jgi:hypothetical protein
MLPRGLEPLTFRLLDERSNRLNYGSFIYKLKTVEGFEPPSPSLENLCIAIMLYDLVCILYIIHIIKFTEGLEPSTFRVETYCATVAPCEQNF